MATLTCVKALEAEGEARQVSARCCVTLASDHRRMRCWTTAARATRVGQLSQHTLGRPPVTTRT